MTDSAPAYDSVSTDFLVLVGRIVIGWSRIERAIDLAMISGQTLIPEHFKKGQPRNLKDKTKAFRALCQKISAFAKCLKWVDQRIDELAALAEYRHTIVHGFFHGISGEAEPQIYFRRAPPLSGESGDRVIATRFELEEFLKKLAQADHEFFIMMTTVIQEVRKNRSKSSA
jgi:hypothetical protein